MFLQDWDEEGSEVIVELGGEWGVGGELWELAVDCPDDLDIVVPDELEIFLLVLLGSGCDGEQKVLVQPALLVFLPV